MKSIEFITEKMVASPSISHIKKVAAMIRKDCAPFLQANKESLAEGHLLYRGIGGIPDDQTGVHKLHVKSGRTPRDSKIHWHSVLDDYLLKTFGWRYRSAALFATQNINNVYYYGKPYIIFPIGEYTMCYSSIVDDFTVDIGGGTDSGSYTRPGRDVATVLRQITSDQYASYAVKYNLPNLNTYQSLVSYLEEFTQYSRTDGDRANSNFIAFLEEVILPKLQYSETKNFDNSEGNEVMIKCSSYYAIDYHSAHTVIVQAKAIIQQVLSY